MAYLTAKSRDPLMSSKRLRATCYQAPNCHISPLLFELYWLPVKQRTIFKILLLTFKIIQGKVPSHLCDLISVFSQGRYNLRRDRQFYSAIPVLFQIKHLVTAHS